MALRVSQENSPEGKGWDRIQRGESVFAGGRRTSILQYAIIGSDTAKAESLM